MRIVLVVLAVMLAAGCDTGGLLKVESTVVDGGTDAGLPVVLGPNEFVSNGAVVANAKYRLVFTTGQATPNQQPVTGKNAELHGGLVGATEGK